MHGRRTCACVFEKEVDFETAMKRRCSWSLGAGGEVALGQRGSGAWGFVSIRRRGATGEPLDLFSFVSSVRPGGRLKRPSLFFLCVAAGDSSGGRLSLRLAEGDQPGVRYARYRRFYQMLLICPAMLRGLVLARAPGLSATDLNGTRARVRRGANFGDAVGRTRRSDPLVPFHNVRFREPGPAVKGSPPGRDRAFLGVELG